MYGRLPSFVLGFHGCERSLAWDVVSGKRKLASSRNRFDWLGEGVYFWENNPMRAGDFARQKQYAKIAEPAVLGAIIDLGYCLNLLDAKFLQVLKDGYHNLKQMTEQAGQKMPQNHPPRGGGEVLLRYLDCAVINTVHALRAEQRLEEFDTVRSAFIEGGELFPGSTFREKNHIQICVRNLKCIKGFFWPVEDSGNEFKATLF